MVNKLLILETTEKNFSKHLNISLENNNTKQKKKKPDAGVMPIDFRNKTPKYKFRKHKIKKQ
jgi:hypothetical protein